MCSCEIVVCNACAKGIFCYDCYIQIDKATFQIFAIVSWNGQWWDGSVHILWLFAYSLRFR